VTAFTRSESDGVPFERPFPGCLQVHELPAGAPCSPGCGRPSDTPASPHTHRLLQTRFAASRGMPPAIDSFGLHDSWIALTSQPGAAGGRHPEPRRPRAIGGGTSAQPARNRACVRLDPTAAHRQFMSKSRTGSIESQITKVLPSLRTSRLTSNFALSTFRGGRHA